MCPCNSFCAYVTKTFIVKIIIIIIIIICIFSESAFNLFLDLRRRIISVTGDDREGLFLYQRLSTLSVYTLQRFNAIMLHQAFVESGDRAGPLVIPASF